VSAGLISARDRASQKSRPPLVHRSPRLQLARRSLDVQSYIWHKDLTGLYFANELLLEADCGVKVRVLLDDVDARRNNDAIAALSAASGYQGPHVQALRIAAGTR